MIKCKHDGQVTEDNCCFKCGVNLDQERIAELEQALRECMYDKSIGRNAELESWKAEATRLLRQVPPDRQWLSQFWIRDVKKLLNGELRHGD